uniref:ATPase H+ transporting accessory protein 1a n=1 Tax=Oryzias sinensis TaxID=183150 RepID=A0A8C7WTC0_9TELE
MWRSSSSTPSCLSVTSFPPISKGASSDPMKEALCSLNCCSVRKPKPQSEICPPPPAEGVETQPQWYSPVPLNLSGPKQDAGLLLLSLSTPIISLSFGISSFAMSQRHYKVSSRRWFTLDFVELEYDGTKATFNGSREIYAPAEYSFRCQSVTSDRWPLLVPRSAKDPANQWKVSFEDFQIQGFNLSGSEFSYASDCAGFFSAGIWMGLMTSLLMVLVLTYGLHMIMQLNTMDRFDDPKGPAISVPQTE